MKLIQPFLLLPLVFTLSLWSATPVPYSGKIDIRGVNYFGEAQFAFSLHDGNGTTHWRNGKQAGETIKVTIRNGRYNVLLGGQGMNSLPPELFLNHDKLYLKVEVDMGDGEGLRHLAPDQLITATPRALVADLAKVSEVAKVAQVAEKVSNGVITREMLSSEVLVKLDANGSSVSVGPITRDMLPQDVRDDLNKTVTITRSMLPADVLADLNRTISKSMLGSDVLADLNKSSSSSSPITLSMLAPEVTAKLDQNGSGGSGIAVGSIISFPSGQTAPAGYSLYQRGEPKALVWEEKAPVSVARLASDGVEVLGGKIYFVGGADSSGTKSIAERYDPETNTWETLNSLSVARQRFAAAVLNGKLYAIGGTGLSSVEVYDPNTGNWTAGVDLPSVVHAGTAITVNNKIYLVGGRNASDQFINQVLSFDLLTNQWTAKANMPTARFGPKLVWFQERVWAISFGNIVESYDPIADSWQTEASLSTNHNWPVAWQAYGVLYAAGGYSSSSQNLSSIEAYDPIQKSWSITSNLPEKKREADAVVLNGVVYVVAGDTGTNTYSNKVFAADLNASVAGVYDIYRKDGNASAGTALVQAEVADGSVTASKMANNSITTTQLSEQILKYLKPEITSQPIGKIVYEDSNASFSVAAEGKFLTYQWKKDGSNVTSETNATMTITDANATQHDGNYSVVVSNDFGSVESGVTEFLVINQNAINQGLVAWYPFDGNASDMSGNGNHGTVYGATLGTDRHGEVGKAYSFDGVNDWIDLNKKLLEENFSLCFWAKIETSHQIQSGEQGLAFYSTYVSGLGGFVAFYLPSNGGYLNFRFHDGSNSTNLNFGGNDSSADFTKWNKIFLSKNENASLFLNSKLVQSVEVNSFLSPSSFTAGGSNNGESIGKASWYDGECFSGSIDDVRIYDRALSAAEVQALYNLGQ